MLYFYSIFHCHYSSHSFLIKISLPYFFPSLFPSFHFSYHHFLYFFHDIFFLFYIFFFIIMFCSYHLNFIFPISLHMLSMIKFFTTSHSTHFNININIITPATGIGCSVLLTNIKHHRQQYFHH